MANIALDGTPTTTNGTLPKIGAPCPEFTLINKDLSSVTLSDYKGKKLVISIFPSVETGVCSAALHTFNERATSHKDTVILSVSKDLPFAQTRFCTAEKINNLEVLSDFRTGQFGRDFGIVIESGAFEGLLARGIVVTDTNHKVVYTELVPDIAQTPDYDGALNALL
jgi:thiol peroxidase